MGNNTKSTGNLSFCIGNKSETVGNNSFVIGSNSKSNSNSFAIGNNLTATDNMIFIGGHVGSGSNRIDISKVILTSGQTVEEHGGGGNIELEKIDLACNNIDCGDLNYHSLINSSDERIKKDIKLISSKETLDKMLNVNAKSYTKKTKSFKELNETGFIAQEIKNLFPDVVSYGNDNIPINTEKYEFDNTDVYTKIKIPNLSFYNLNNNCKVNLLIEGEVKTYPISLFLEHYDTICLHEKINIDNIKLLGFKVNNFHFISYPKLIPYMISSIQELHNIIFAQQKEIEKLKMYIN